MARRNTQNSGRCAGLIGCIFRRSTATMHTSSAETMIYQLKAPSSVQIKTAALSPRTGRFILSQTLRRRRCIWRPATMGRERTGAVIVAIVDCALLICCGCLSSSAALPGNEYAHPVRLRPPIRWIVFVRFCVNCTLFTFLLSRHPNVQHACKESMEERTQLYLHPDSQSICCHCFLN